MERKMEKEESSKKVEKAPIMTTMMSQLELGRSNSSPRGDGLDGLLRASKGGDRSRHSNNVERLCEL